MKKRWNRVLALAMALLMLTGSWSGMAELAIEAPQAPEGIEL